MAVLFNGAAAIRRNTDLQKGMPWECLPKKKALRENGTKGLKGEKGKPGKGTKQGNP